MNKFTETWPDAKVRLVLAITQKSLTLTCTLQGAQLSLHLSSFTARLTGNIGLRGEHCQLPSDGPGLTASVASPGCEKSSNEGN